MFQESENGWLAAKHCYLDKPSGGTGGWCYPTPKNNKKGSKHWSKRSFVGPGQQSCQYTLGGQFQGCSASCLCWWYSCWLLTSNIESFEMETPSCSPKLMLQPFTRSCPVTVTINEADVGKVIISSPIDMLVVPIAFILNIWRIWLTHLLWKGVNSSSVPCVHSFLLFWVERHHTLTIHLHHFGASLVTLTKKMAALAQLLYAALHIETSCC